MFSKIKNRKAPLSLNSVTNAIKTHGSQDLSPNDFQSKNLDLSVITQLGLPKNLILATAYDPVQSLLAISTTSNEIRVYGLQNVEVVFEFKSSSPITHLAFVKGVYLVGISSSSGNVTVLSLHSKQILQTYLASSAITAIASDPSLDWLVLGLANGSLHFFDVDRLALAPFRVDNLQKKVLPKQKLSPVVSIEWHPRDIGSLLVTYSHCSVLYSISGGDITNSFIYQVPKGSRGYEYSQYVANGGKKKLFGSSSPVLSEVIGAQFHPNGLHVLTVHQDSTLVFWDTSDATLIEARNLFDLHLQLPGPPIDPPLFQISSVRWVCAANPERTQLVISGSSSVDGSGNTLHVIDFDHTLKYSMTSHAKQAEFYSQPQNGQKIIPITLNEGNDNPEVPEFIDLILPLSVGPNPYFGGNHDPKYLLLKSNYRSIYFIKYGSSDLPPGVIPTATGGAISNDLGNLILPMSIGFVHPPILFSSLNSIRRIDWFSIITSRASTGASSVNQSLLKGGFAIAHVGDVKSIGANDGERDILITGHENGLVRLQDVSRGENANMENIVQISLKETLFDDGKKQSTRIEAVSCSFESREMIVGLGNGDVVICKYGKRRAPGQGQSGNSDYRDCPLQHSNGNAKILSLNDRIQGTFSQSATFLPVSLVQVEAEEEISCLKMSNVGFGAIAYKSGRLVVCDITRGPAIILNLDSISKHLPSVSGQCYATTMEFSIMEFGQEGFSSILLFVGTNCGGNLIIFKILPQSNGGFEVVFADKTLGLNYRLTSEDPTASKLDDLIPISAKDGRSAVATLETFHKLGQGILIPGYLITSSKRDLRVLKLPKTKLSHKVIEDGCVRSGIVELALGKILLASIVKTGFIKFCSVPALNDVAEIKFSKDLYVKLKSALESEVAEGSKILPSGNFFIKTSFTESIHLRACQKESRLRSSKGPLTDQLFNENAIIPQRPTAGALLWAKGQTKYTSVEDLAFLIGGPNRKPAKHEESRLAHNISPEANPQGGYAELGGQNERGYKEPQRKNGPQGYGIGNAGFMRSLQTGIDSVEESFHGYASNVSEAMNEGLDSGKKSFYGAAIKSKLGI
ncbi:uncharacterized protein CANTADRAFT_65534 [Suhomyces tanzawaensis NRRL Y-17324]|uniref:Lethal giant larvae (Lgl)-like C-terminal domain-containing protein n=1 Tax=Suhomyces tanzawaensis NRRL Y-17324 TaxID=984487 RepID=A0A1E4SHB5_9ASCO|nr:uncharacterized protein CANTADRAFT_65534 [Suhomyces tanzawaensis NRRL Y-17324]ODV78898.1 hypothetical protein CANTADRAFT_65534 [Suhomyces tanzawaensis NRRL Y-17324]